MYNAEVILLIFKKIKSYF